MILGPVVSFVLIVFPVSVTFIRGSMYQKATNIQ